MLKALVLSSLLSVVVPSTEPSEARLEAIAEGYVQAFNSGDGELYEVFVDKHFVPSRSEKGRSAKERHRELWDRLGQIEVGDIDFAGPLVIVLGCVSQKKGAVELSFEFESAPPHRVVSVSFEFSSGPSFEMDLPELDFGSNRADVGRVLDPYLKDLADRDLYSGTTFIARGGKALYRSAHGLASKSFLVPNTTQTRFRVGSLTKDYTRVAVGLLVAEEKIDPHVPIGKYLPDYPNSEVAKKVTVDHLLRHRSGMGGMNFGEFQKLSKKRFRSPADYFELFADQPLLFEPGRGQRYSNAGYIVLGAVVAAVSGTSYAEFVEERVFGAAGMGQSGFLSLEDPHPGIAVGYWKCRGKKGPWCNNYHTLEIEGGPSGGSYSTAEDLFRFDQALRDHRLLTPEYTRWFFSEKWPDPSQRSSMGNNDYPAVGMAGGAEGVSALVFSDGDWFLCVLCNYDEPIAEEIGGRIFEALIKR